MTKEQTLAYDTSVKMPAAVLAAAARSEEYFNAYRDQPEQGTEEQQQVTSQGNPEQSSASLAQGGGVQNPAPQETAPAPGDESWEHKYKSVHGRYTRSQEQIRQMSEQIQGLQNVVATMQATAASAPSTASLPDFSTERLITPEEASDYGEDFLKVVGKKAREELAPVIGAYQQKITELEQRLQGVSGAQAQDSHQKLMSTLDEKLPTWRDLNTNEEFLSWLQLPDAYSGDIRHNMLKAAYAQGNAHRVLAFFNGFLAEEAAVAPAQGEPDYSTTTVPKVPLQNFAAPGRAKTAASANAPAEKLNISRAQVASFYADVAAGRYRGREAEKNKLEAQIFDAQREGRLR
jgi:hypothetical protein